MSPVGWEYKSLLLLWNSNKQQHKNIQLAQVTAFITDRQSWRMVSLWQEILIAEPTMSHIAVSANVNHELVGTPYMVHWILHYVDCLPTAIFSRIIDLWTSKLKHTSVWEIAMERKFFVGGNWKMNGSKASIDGILKTLAEADLNSSTGWYFDFLAMTVHSFFAKKALWYQ